jgi:ribosome-associated protein
VSEQRDEPGEGGIEIAPGLRVPPGALRFSYASSSGPGGQNVNKRATKAVLRLALDEVPVDDRVRSRLVRMAKGWLVGDADEAGPLELVIQADEYRSQRRNREACLERLRELLVRAMARPKPRVATRPGRGAIERRLKAKREQAEKKSRRRQDGPPE